MPNESIGRVQLKELAVNERLQLELPLINQFWRAMREDLLALDYGELMPEYPPEFSKAGINIDTYDGGKSFYGEWWKQGQRFGNFISHTGGNAFAEVDVIKPHPQDRRWFIEAVTAWGNLKKVNSELRLLPMP